MWDNLINAATNVASKYVDYDIAKKNAAISNVTAPPGTSPDAKASGTTAMAANSKTLLIVGGVAVAVLGLGALVLVTRRRK